MAPRRYNADPGGIFSSDAHRRTLAHLPKGKEEPISLDDLAVRMAPDAVNIDPLSATPLVPNELNEILKDLEAEGDAKELKDGWRMTPEGLKRLMGPVANEPPPAATAK